MFGLRKKITGKFVTLDWHQTRQREWEKFTKACEKFDYVKFSNGSAVGYMKSEMPEFNEPTIVGTGGNVSFIMDINKGTMLLMPFEVITPYGEF